MSAAEMHSMIDGADGGEGSGSTDEHGRARTDTDGVDGEVCGRESGAVGRPATGEDANREIGVPRGDVDPLEEQVRAVCRLAGEAAAENTRLRGVTAGLEMRAEAAAEAAWDEEAWTEQYHAVLNDIAARRAFGVAVVEGLLGSLDVLQRRHLVRNTAEQRKFVDEVADLSDALALRFRSRDRLDLKPLLEARAAGEAAREAAAAAVLGESAAYRVGGEGDGSTDEHGRARTDTDGGDGAGEVDGEETFGREGVDGDGDGEETSGREGGAVGRPATEETSGRESGAVGRPATGEVEAGELGQDAEATVGEVGQ